MCFNEWENNCKKISSFRNYDSTEKWLIKKQLLFLLIFFKSIFKYYEWSLQFTSMKLKRVISTKSINVNIIKLYFEKYPSETYLNLQNITHDRSTKLLFNFHGYLKHVEVKYLEWFFTSYYKKAKQNKLEWEYFVKAFFV